MEIVRFSCADINGIKLRERRKIKAFVKSIFEMEGKELKEINYIFCSDLYLLEINRKYLQHDYLTDIITFDLSESNATVGEVYISSDRVSENSKIHRTTYSQELLRVIFHGALHLVGYKDKKKSEITIMRSKEDYYLRLFAEP